MTSQKHSFHNTVRLTLSCAGNTDCRPGLEQCNRNDS